MKIETIEEAIQIIESAGFMLELAGRPIGTPLLPLPKSCIVFCVAYKNHYLPMLHGKDELIEFAHKCQLKAWW